MKTAPVPDNEAQRLASLDSYGILDSPPETAFDELALLAAHICDAPIALISLIDEKRQWFKARVGIETQETPRDLSFCAHAIVQPEKLLVVPDATADERFASNPLVTADPRIRFYAGAPLVTPEGQALGTLCVIDRVPRELAAIKQQALHVLSRHVMTQMELRRRSIELARVLADLQSSEDRYRDLFENASDLIHIVDPEGHFLFVNRAWRDTLGYSSEDIQKLFMQDVVHPDSWQHCRDIFQRELAGEKSERIEAAFVKKNGQTINVEGSFGVRFKQDKPVSARAIFHDVTESKRAQQALHELNEELRAATGKAQTADRIKSAFLATMSHELRTPLNSIIGFTGVVLQEMPGPLNAEQKKQLGMVQGSARHLLELINDVLDISKIEAGELAINYQPFNLAASVDNAVNIIRPLAGKKGLALRISVDESVGEMAGDARRVEQILINLLGNAVKFTETGLVTLTVEPVTDFIAGKNAAPRPAIRLRVSDTGIGIKPENMAILFTPFRQVDSALSRKYDGTGLGLAICRRLAELMGGRIEAESRWGEGSTFTLLLPQHLPKGME